MTGSQCHHTSGITGTDTHGSQREAFTAGGTGTVKSEQRNLQFHDAVRGGDALGQKIPGKKIADFFFRETRFFQYFSGGPKLQLAFCLLPCVFAEFWIFLDTVEEMSERSVTFFASDNGSCPDDTGRTVKEQSCFSGNLCHTRTFLSNIYL